MPQPLPAFLDRAAFLLDGGCEAHVTAVCVRAALDSPWVSYLTKIVLGPRGQLELPAPRALVKLDRLRVVQGFVPA